MGSVIRTFCGGACGCVSGGAAPGGALRAPDIILRPFGYRLTPSSPPPPQGPRNRREPSRGEPSGGEPSRGEPSRGEPREMVPLASGGGACTATAGKGYNTRTAAGEKVHVVYIWCPPEGGNMRNGAAAEGRRMRKWRPLRRSVSGSCALTCVLLVFPGSSAGARRRSQRSNSRCSEVARGRRSRRRQGCRGAVARELR